MFPLIQFYDLPDLQTLVPFLVKTLGYIVEDIIMPKGKPTLVQGRFTTTKNMIKGLTLATKTLVVYQFTPLF